MNFVLGGVAAQACRTFHRLFQADESPFLQTLVQLDTHRGDACSADVEYFLETSTQDMEAILTNAPLFGADAVAILEEMKHLLRPGDILNGARTTRCLTQLLFLAHKDTLCRVLRAAISELRRKARFKQIRPVFISSSGGGTGSSLQLLLMLALECADFRRRLLLGEDELLLLSPIAFVVEPFHYARVVGDTQAHKVLANSYAFRVETEYLMQTGLGPDYVFHLGYSNDEGTVIASAELMGRTLGECVYQIERNWPEFKKHWVDNVDSNASFSRYRGEDTAKRLFPWLFASLADQAA
ncbi:MAG: hypothetical protein GXY83_39180 [Rhodopirellula sp.]|nr:hypothetical protein [Rhodopirellula sp.]